MKGWSLAGALPVDGAGDQLLARPRLSGDEDGGRRRGDLADDLLDLRHGTAGADDPVGVRLSGRRREVLVVHQPGLDGLQDDRLEFILLEGLGDVVEGPLLQGIDGSGDGAVGGEDDHRQGGVVPHDPFQEPHPVQPRHLEIRGDDGDLLRWPRIFSASMPSAAVLTS